MILRNKNWIPWLVSLGFALLFVSSLLGKASLKLEPPVTHHADAATFTAQQDIIETLDSGPEEYVNVVRVIDGDTIEIEGGVRVRYIGIDTPEPGQCFGGNATEENQKLVDGAQIKLETDIERLDRYGRLLAYVFVGDIFVNDQLVLDGVATVTTYPPNVKYVNQFLESQKKAQKDKRGVWSDSPCPATEPTQAEVKSQETGCLIKGNISSSGEKIYHTPGQRYYERTKITPDKGEQWFCSEDEAVQVGWRKAKV